MQSDARVPVRFEGSAVAHGGPTDLAHDARLRRGLLDTDVSRPVAITLMLGFVLCIGAVPIAQAVLEHVNDEPSSLAPLFEHAPSAEAMKRFEHDLEEASYFQGFVQPKVQALLSGLLGVGNKRVVIGAGGALFYTPGVMHVAGPNFLDRGVLAAREATEPGSDEASVIHPDPRPAIFAFHDMLVRRGIELVVFPVPDKAMLQPIELHGRGRTQAALPVARNPGWAAFVSELREHGVRVFDPAPRKIARSDAARFLVQDTHWTPTWMREVAVQLARYLEREAGLVPGGNPRDLHAVDQPARRVGDLVDMLKLGEEQTTFQPQSVQVAQVRDAHDGLWDANQDAEVLLLGDSFTNVFSDASMDWGEAAGLAPQLSLALGRDVDVIAQNDAGAYATRALLYRMLQSGQDRLHGKRVVIWEFASRELSVGDFKPLAWERLAAPEAR